MNHLGTRVGLLVVVGYSYAIELGHGVVARQYARRVFPRDGTTRLHLRPRQFAVHTLADATLGDEVVYASLALSVTRIPVLHGTVLHFGPVVHHDFYNGGMQLVLITHRCGTAFQVGNVGIVIGYNQSPFKLSRTLCIDTEVGRQLHRASYPLGNIHKRPVGENSRVECGKEIVAVRHHRAQVLLYQVGMFAYGLAHRAEDDAFLHQCFLEGSLHGNGVHHGVHGHAAQRHLLLQRNAQLVEGLDQLGIYLIHALGALLLLGRVGVIRNSLVINLRNTEMGPRRHLQRQPVAVSLQAELQHPVGLSLLFGDKTDNILVQTLLDHIGMHIGRKAILVLFLREFLDVFIGFFLSHILSIIQVHRSTY